MNCQKCNKHPVKWRCFQYSSKDIKLFCTHCFNDFIDGTVFPKEYPPSKNGKKGMFGDRGGGPYYE